METQIGRRKGVVLEDVAGFIWLDFWRMKLLCSLHAPLCNARNVKLGEFWQLYPRHEKKICYVLIF